jgi:hypothetical protein
MKTRIYGWSPDMERPVKAMVAWWMAWFVERQAALGRVGG